MRKQALSLIVGLLAVLFLSSCATSISVKHLVPSDVDLSRHRAIAIASTDIYKFPRGGRPSPWIPGSSDTSFSLSSGFDSDLNSKVANATTTYLVDAMVKSDYFTVMAPQTTDAYLVIGKDRERAYPLLREQGVQALLQSSITYMNSEEQIVGRDIKEWVTENPDPKDPTATSKVISYEKVSGRSYYLEQRATMTFTYTLIDLESSRVLATESFTLQHLEETCLGKTIFGVREGDRDQDERCYSSGFAPSFFPLYDKMIKDIPTQIAKHLAPSWSQSRVTLMSNKPKADVAHAYKMAEQGDLQPSFEIFFQEWQSSAHLPSGYNAALLLEGMGQYSEALTLMNQVHNKSGNTKSYEQLIRLKEVSSQQSKAMKQIDGTTGIVDGEMVKTQILTAE